MKLVESRCLFQVMFAPICVIGVIHIIGGLAALFAPGAALVTGLSGLTMTGAGSAQIAVTLIVVGFLAITARLSALPNDLRLFMITPQQVVLFVQAVGVLVALFNGCYPDGYQPAPTLAASRWFILGDQAPLLVLCLSHAADMVFARRIAVTRVQLEEALAEQQLLRNEIELNHSKEAWLNFTRDIVPKR